STSPSRTSHGTAVIVGGRPRQPDRYLTKCAYDEHLYYVRTIVVYISGWSGGAHTHDGFVERDVPGRAEEDSVAEGEDPTIGCHQPITLTRRRRGHPNNRLVQLNIARRSQESCITKREDAAVRRHQPITLTRRRRRHPHNRLVQRN